MVHLIFHSYTLLTQELSEDSTGVSVKMTMVVLAGIVIVSTLIEIGDTIIVRIETREVVDTTLVSIPIVGKTNTMITMTGIVIVSTLIEIRETMIVRETGEVADTTLVSNPIVGKTNTMITMIAAAAAAAIHHAVLALQIPMTQV
jgi:hypothetical protein